MLPLDGKVKTGKGGVGSSGRTKGCVPISSEFEFYFFADFSLTRNWVKKLYDQSPEEKNKFKRHASVFQVQRAWVRISLGLNRASEVVWNVML